MITIMLSYTVKLVLISLDKFSSQNEWNGRKLLMNNEVINPTIGRNEIYSAEDIIRVTQCAKEFLNSNFN